MPAPTRSTSCVTAGSITLNINCGNTPNTTIAIRNGVQAIHSIDRHVVDVGMVLVVPTVVTSALAAALSEWATWP